ncbi:MAG: CD225/dispanin family protein [Bacteroidales bacterium]|nr:CD225/dispanin family protein [Bacteroidales bacterium]
MEKQNLKQKPPKTWLVESILVTLFCCLPFGIAGIVNAAKVESRFYAGDYEGANRASEQAGKWTKIGFWIGLAVIVIYGIVMIIVALSGY